MSAFAMIRHAERAARQRAFRQSPEGRAHTKRHNIRRNYGVPATWYEQALEHQAGLCAAVEDEAFIRDARVYVEACRGIE